VGTLALRLGSVPSPIAVVWADDPRGVNATPPIFRLCGPNDGEPINSRTLTLKLFTSFSEQATIDVSVNGVPFGSRSLHYRSRLDPATGLYMSPVEIDLEQVQRTIPWLFDNPDAPPLEVTILLHSSRGPVTFTEWEGYIGRPWVEFLTTSPDRNPVGRGGAARRVDGPVPTGMVGIVVHPLSRDSYYFLVASTRPDILRLSPENPRLLREGKVLGGENWYVPRAGDAPPRKVIVVDPRDFPAGTQVVLWTHSFYGGWKRSPLFLLPR